MEGCTLMITGAEEDGEGNILSSNTEDQQDLSITDEVSHMEVSYSHLEVSYSHMEVSYSHMEVSYSHI